ncbi:Suppressor of Sensor Kinase (SLN1), partial [Serendipita sp. 399]
DAEVSSSPKKIKRERTVWEMLDHPNILTFYGFTEEDDRFQPLGALISPSNVLIDDNGIPRICDFGLVAIYLEAGNSGLTTTSPHSGTERYLAPELVITEDHARTTTASDVYAVGCIGLEFVFSLLPYNNRRNCHSGLIIGDIFRGVKPANRPSQLDNSLEGVWSSVERCLNRDANQRPTAGELSSRLEVFNVHSDPPLDSTQIPDAGEALHNSDPETTNAPPDSTQSPVAEEVLLRTQIVDTPNENGKKTLVHDDRSIARQSEWKNDDQAWTTTLPIAFRNLPRPFTEYLKLMGDMQRWGLRYTFEPIQPSYGLRWIATVLLSDRRLAVSTPQRSKEDAKEMAAMEALR